MALRTDITYVDDAGRLTQAGWQALTRELANVPIATGDAPIYACRAWVNFNGTGTVAIRASGNVASITDNGVGDYTINFTTPMEDADYAVALSYTNEVNVQHAIGFVTTQTASSVRVGFYSATSSALTADKSTVNVAIFR